MTMRNILQELHIIICYIIYDQSVWSYRATIDSSEKAIDSTDDRLQPIKCFVLASQTNRNVTIFFL